MNNMYGGSFVRGDIMNPYSVPRNTFPRQDNLFHRRSFPDNNVYDEPEYSNQNYFANSSYGGGFIRNTSQDQLSDYQNHTVYGNGLPFENNAPRYAGQRRTYNIPYQNENKRDFKGQKITKKSLPVASASKNGVSLTTFDSTLPRKLTELLEPQNCKLCMASLTSTVMAKIHYESAKHEKKVKQFLIKYAEETGEPLHKRAMVSNKVDKSAKTDPKYLRCEACDIPFTGRIHAESHYMGKNHQRVISGKSAPVAKANKTANKEKKTVFGDGFGESFHENGASDGTELATEKKNDKPSQAIICEMCRVTCISEHQMEMHVNGQKHQKRQKQLTEGLIPVVKDSDPKYEVADLKQSSACNTPNGSYYCASCNIIMNSGVQFLQHVSSKKHARKISVSQSK